VVEKKDTAGSPALHGPTSTDNGKRYGFYTLPSKR